jgi:hypothetical protein
MRCSFCDCKLSNGLVHFNNKWQCCSEACYNAKSKEHCVLECNRLINQLKKDIETLHADGDEIHEYDVKGLKLFKFILICCVSVRDKKGTYPALKAKTQDFIVDFMDSVTKDSYLLGLATFAKKIFELLDEAHHILS